MKNFEKRVIYFREDYFAYGQGVGEVSMGGTVHQEGRYRRNIADIISNWSDICSTANISKLYAIFGG
jgi:hypothetical protein